MTPEQRQHIHVILDELDRALGAFQESSLAFDLAVKGLQLSLNGVSAANRAQGAAIEAVIAANRATITLLRTDEQDQ